ncbi:MAG: hypothetical protein HKN47_25365 [Pirellulaceae bacterium]|nr:hypothetical protein [Pirellulaceae bacterium]
MENTNETPAHVIRLRRPWTRCVAGGSESTKIDVPEIDAAQSVISRSTATTPSADVIYQRRFNRPSGLDADSQVQLRIETWQGNLVSVHLNDVPLDLANNIDITSQVRDHNLLSIQLAPRDDQLPRLTGPVNLAILQRPS